MEPNREIDDLFEAVGMEEEAFGQMTEAISKLQRVRDAKQRLSQLSAPVLREQIRLRSTDSGGAS